MSLRENVIVRTEYTRSVNIERDEHSGDIATAYIPTSRAILTLRQVSEGFAAVDRPRAWALVGPYGSGKSSFALFLSALLGEPKSTVQRRAIARLGEADTGLAKDFERHLKGSKGYCRVLISGSPEPLARRVVKGLQSAAARFWGSRRGRTPLVVKGLADLANAPTVSVSEVLKIVGELQDALARAGGRGILFVIDELGKFLEYEARHSEANDVFLLQALAERAYAKHRAPLQLFVLMHQAFDQYARGLSRNLRDDWAKVQGRFENIPFLEAAEQTLRVVSAALHSSLPRNVKTKIKRKACETAAALGAMKALPPGVSEPVAADLFEGCYPLHPISALILPQLCQRVAQNERTLFSYLGSHEPHGFQEWLNTDVSPGDYVLPWQIYEYFILNQPAVLADPATHRRWAEVVTAVERLGDSEPTAAHLLKTIGLLNLIGSRGGLKAAPEVLGLCVASEGRLDQSLELLESKSLVQYRKFSGEYRVWQGSDFDLDEAIDAESAELGQFRLADVLNARIRLEPIVARRYTIESHTIRSFQPRFVDRDSVGQLQDLRFEPVLVLFLAEDANDVRFFVEEHANRLPVTAVAAICRLGGQLRQALVESLALERIQASRPELSRDPVAARECRDRLEAALTAERALIAEVLGNPVESRWFWKGEELPLLTPRQLQSRLSSVLVELYSCAPIIPNELINRDAPSSTANAARNKLLARLLTHADQEDLGIEKFPAEKAMYRAILRSSRIHRKVEGQWKLLGPDKRDPCNFAPVWRRIDLFLEETEHGPLPFTTLDEDLTGVPFGIKGGVLPILYALAYLARQDELALYEEGAYVPGLDSATLDRLLRRPESFSVQRFRVEGLRAKIFGEYAKALYADAEKVESLLSIAKPLVKFVFGLEDYTKQTRVLSPTARAVRGAILHAKSPQKLIYEELPVACGFSRADSASEARSYDDFAGVLMNALRELKQAYSILLQEQATSLAKGLGVEANNDLDSVRRVVAGRYAGLEKFCLEADELGAFLRRLCNNDEPVELWLEKILLFLGRKPSAKWSDEDRATAQFRLTEFARRVRDLEKIRFAYDGAARGVADTQMILLRAVRQGERDLETVVAMDANSVAAAEKYAEEIWERLSDLGDERLRRAVLATLTVRTLEDNQQSLGADGVNDKPKARRRNKVNV
jgi:hypothetical protein